MPIILTIESLDANSACRARRRLGASRSQPRPCQARRSLCIHHRRRRPDAGPRRSQGFSAHARQDGSRRWRGCRRGGAIGGVESPSARAQDVKDVPREKTLILRWAGASRPLRRSEPLERLPDRLQPPERPRNPARATGLLQRLRRRDHPLAGGELGVQRGLHRPCSIKTRSGIILERRHARSRRRTSPTPSRTAGELGSAVKWGVDVSTFLEIGRGGDGDRRPPDVQDSRATLHVLHDLQVRHRLLHRAEAHLRGPGLERRSRTSISPPGCRSPLDRGRSSSPRRSRRSSTGATPGGRWMRASSPQCRTVERIIYLPAVPDEQMAQQLISNEVDCSLDLRPLTIETVMTENPNIITHTGTELPYGYVDWWPTSLYVNNEREPFDRSGRALGAQLLHRSRPDHRRCPRRCRFEVAAAAALLSGPAALRRRRRGPARGVPDAGVQPRKRVTPC